MGRPGKASTSLGLEGCFSWTKRGSLQTYDGLMPHWAVYESVIKGFVKAVGGVQQLAG